MAPKPRVPAPNDFHRTVLTEEAWKKIMKLYLDEDNPMSRAALAKRFGVSYETLWQGIKARLGKEDSRKKDRVESEADPEPMLPQASKKNFKSGRQRRAVMSRLRTRAWDL